MQGIAQKRLSDTRGAKFGIKFFRFWYRTWGYSHTKVMVWFVTFFYALFDLDARKKVAPYLRHRFPNSNIFSRLRHTWFLFAHQGMSLLRQEMYEELGCKYQVIYDSEEAKKIRFSETATVVVYSHFGPWQVMMRNIAHHENAVNIMAQPDKNTEVDKMKSFFNNNSVNTIRQIAPTPGSLMLLQQALEKNEFVTMMGDRNFEEFPLEVQYLGAKAYFPVAAFYLAARMNCPLICIFAHLHNDEYVLEFCDVMHPKMNGRDREQLRPYLEKYTQHLERLCMEYPYDCFSMFNHWSQE